MAELTIRRRTGALAAATALAAMACTAAIGPDSTTGTVTNGVSQQTTAAATAATSTTAGSQVPPATEQPDGLVPDDGCPAPSTRSDGRLNRVEVTEASGLVASRRHQGVLWTHDDRAEPVGVHATDASGRDLGFFTLDGLTGVDVEDIAMIDDTIVVADIGDNQRRRATIELYLFPEPDPVDQPGGGGTITDHATVTLQFADGPTDAEALLVDPIERRIVILSKNLPEVAAPTGIHSVPLPEPMPAAGTTGPVIEIPAAAAEIDLLVLEAADGGFAPAAFLFPGAATGADISADGSLVAVRTYAGIWTFERPSGASLLEAFGGEPCFAGSPPELQGEAVAILPADPSAPNRLRLATVGEGTGVPIHVIDLQ